MTFFFQGAAGPVVTPPVLVSATVDSSGAKLVLVFDVPVTGNVGFSLTADAAPIALSAPVNAADTITFTCEQVYQGETCLLSYTAGDVQDLEGDPLANFTDDPVTNNSTVQPSVNYLLSANFNAIDQSFVSSQILDTPAEGVQAGSLEAANVNNFVGIEASRLKTINGTTMTANLVKSPSHFSRLAGLALLSDFRVSSANGGGVGWWGSSFGHLDRGAPAFGLRNGAPQVSWDTNKINRLAESISASTDYRACLILGGYDINKTPLKAGDDRTDFKTGGAVLVKGDVFDKWKLLFRINENSNDVSCCTSNRAVTAFYDNFVIPDVDLSDLLEPTVLDTFTGTNGTALNAHVPDVNPEGGSWSGTNWQIQDNRAQSTTIERIAIETGKADVVAESIVNLSAGGIGGLSIRFLDEGNTWLCGINQAAGELKLVERNAGVNTQRGSVALPAAADTDYRILAVCDAQNIFCYFNDSLFFIKYEAAAFQQTATKHGIYQEGGTVHVDNFAVYPRGTGDEYSQLDTYTGLP